MKQKARFYILSVMAILCALCAQAQNVITMTTSKAAGETITLQVTATGSVTITGVKETTFNTNFNPTTYTLTGQTVTITGNVSHLNCSQNQLTALDVSNDTELNYLDCSYNQLTALDVSKDTELNYLLCTDNQLKSLDMSKNANLSSLSINENQIKGKNMDALIASLPDKAGKEAGTFQVGYAENGNLCSTLQVDAAKKKNWSVTDASGADFTGVTIREITTDATTNGTISITNPTDEIAGKEKINVNYTATAGYYLSALTATYTDANGAEQTIYGSFKPSESGTTTFTMPDADVTVHASFSTNPSITMTSAVNGTMTVKDNATTAAPNAEVTVNYTANEGYGLSALVATYKDASGATKKIQADYDPTVTSGTATFIMPAADVTISATFTGLRNITLTATDNGTITLNNNATQIASGATAQVNYKAADGYYISTLNATYTDTDGKEKTETVKYDASLLEGTATFTMPDADVKVSAIFSTYPAITITAPTNGTISVKDGATTAAPGSNVTLNYAADEGFGLATLNITYKDGNDETQTIQADYDLTMTSGTATFTMPAADVTVSATFGKLHNITLTEADNGRISQYASLTPSGAEVKINYNASEGCFISAMDVSYQDANGETKTAEVKYLNDSRGYGDASFIMPDADVTVGATFVTNPTITIGTITGATATLSATTATPGTLVTIDVTPDQGNAGSLSCVPEGGKAATIATGIWYAHSCPTFLMPTTNVVINGSFAPMTSSSDLAIFMPTTGTLALTIPEKFNSMKIYDDGGEKNNYSFNCNGTLELTAPAKYMIRLKGTVASQGPNQWSADPYDYLSVYNGVDATDSTQYFSTSMDYNANVAVPVDVDMTTTGNTVKLHFISDGGFQAAGIDLALTLIDPSTAGITAPDTAQATDDDAWYTLQGMRLSAKPTQRGLYIHHNKKIVVR